MINRRSVAVVGLGYVGLPLALLAKNKDFEVSGIDYDKGKISLIQNGKSPFIDEEVTSQLKVTKLDVSNNYSSAKNASIIIVCVPTPVDDSYVPDLTPVTSACSEIAKILQKDQLIIIESTINPGVCDEIIIPLLEKESGLTCGVDFSLAHCPERINPGDPNWNVGNISRVVGGFDDKSLKLAVEFYEHLITGDVKAMGSLREAEAVKVVENSFRDINIAFVNELAMSFTKLGIDIVNVIDGAATKPFAFMAHYPGVGVGGHCIPVDPYYLIEYAHKNGFTHKFLKTARDINNGMPKFTIDRLEDGLKEAGIQLKDAKITVLGLSYKPNVGDLRESPSLVLVKLLQDAGADIVTHDPYIDTLKNTKSQHSSSPSINKSIDAAINQADAVIVATAHDEYKKLEVNSFTDQGVKVIIDGRNCLNKNKITKAGLIYRGIGR